MTLIPFDIRLIDKGFGARIVCQCKSMEFEVQGVTRIPNSDFVAVISNGAPLIFRMNGEGESNSELRLMIDNPEIWVWYSVETREVSHITYGSKQEAEADNCYDDSEEERRLPARLVFE